MRKHVIAVALLVAVSTVTIAQNISTRFGALKIGGEFANILSFKGRRLVKGDNALSVVQKFRMGKTDVVLIQETGGTACPALYYFVSVSASGAKATHAFGTCDEFTKITRKKDTILVTMPGYRGPFEPEADRAKAAQEKHVFAFKAGRVTAKGKAVK
jgi:hypothetical protein